jgi:hypothetical protein
VFLGDSEIGSSTLMTTSREECQLRRKDDDCRVRNLVIIAPGSKRSPVGVPTLIGVVGRATFLPAAHVVASMAGSPFLLRSSARLVSMLLTTFHSPSYLRWIVTYVFGSENGTN